MAAASTGLLLVGAAGVPAATLIGLPLLLGAMVPTYVRAVQGLTKRRRLTVFGHDAVGNTLHLYNGLFLMASSMTVLVAMLERLHKATERASERQMMSAIAPKADTAWLLRNGIETEVSVDTLKAGDIVVVTSGEVIPVDGVIVEGHGGVDKLSFTGEPVGEIGPGAEVFAGALVLSGRLLIETEKTGQETVAGQLQVALHEAAEARDAASFKWRDLADRTVLPAVVGGGLVGLAFGPVAAGLFIAIAGVAYPMRLAAPMALLLHIQKGLRQNILIKDGRALENLGQIDTIVFDKTGTLTTGQLVVDEVTGFSGYDREEVLSLAARAEGRHPHPIAMALRAAATLGDKQISPSRRRSPRSATARLRLP